MFRELYVLKTIDSNKFEMNDKRNVFKPKLDSSTGSTPDNREN